MDDMITITADSAVEPTTAITISGIEPSVFAWNESDMSTGIIAQEIGPIGPLTTILAGGGTGISTVNTVTIGSSDDYSYVNKTEFRELTARLEKLESMLAEEAEIRANHPAVERAYDEYRLLMILSKKNPGDFLTEDQ